MVNSGCCTLSVPSIRICPLASLIRTVLRDPSSKTRLVSTSRHPCSGFHVPGVSPSPPLAGSLSCPACCEFGSDEPVVCPFSVPGRAVPPDACDCSSSACGCSDCGCSTPRIRLPHLLKLLKNSFIFRNIKF